MKRVAVIGAGAAGLIASYAAAVNGADVTVFEKNEKPGKKIYITGKGRCNVTNACDRDTFFENIIRNPKFMYKSFNAFSNYDLMDFIEENGTKLKTERGNRVFPVSDHASDITKALLNTVRDLNVKFKFNNAVERILLEDKSQDKKIKGLICNGREYQFDSVITACGGASYPGAGGSKLGFELLKNIEVQVTDLQPSLVPFLLNDDFIKEIQGLSLKNITLSIYESEKQIFKEFGEILFTHFGISGPLVLTASAKVGEYLMPEKTKIFIDLKPAIPDNELDKRLIDIIEGNKKKKFSSFYDGLLPKSLKPVMVKLVGIDENLRLCDINKENRKKIFEYIRRFPLSFKALSGFNEAVVTRGGVFVKEIDPKTMEHKKIKGLYVCGEMLDVDALTGGFNLQIAFSTGYSAGLYAGLQD